MLRRKCGNSSCHEMRIFRSRSFTESSWISGSMTIIINPWYTDLDQLSKVICTKNHNLAQHSRKATFTARTQTTLSCFSSVKHETFYMVSQISDEKQQIQGFGQGKFFKYWVRRFCSGSSLLNPARFDL